MPSKDHLRRRYDELLSLQGMTPQQRGYAFEELVLDLARHEGVPCWPPYRPKGEQVDGLLQLDGRYFLIEASWLFN